MPVMKLLLSLFAILIPAFSTSGSFFAQTPYTASPVKWEKYRDPDENIAVSLPKMPTKVEKYKPCVRSRGTSYYAYADNAVYEFTIFTPSSHVSYLCTNSIKFDQDLLISRIAELNEADPKDPSLAAAATDKNVVRVKKDDVTRLVFPEMAKRRWVELAIHHPKDISIDEQKFFNSIDLNSKDGIKLGDGADSTFGDEDVDIDHIPVANPAPTSIVVTSPIKIIAKPNSPYTDEARKNNLQGSVTLKITLLRNGAIGSITTVSGLKYGLTEQAIAAAKRIVFLPKRINGVSINTTLTFDYGFSIY
jgi:TonB family protein